MKDLVPIRRRPDIIFRRDGLIEIHARVSRMLNLRRGDAVGFCSDGPEYYIYRQRPSEAIVGNHPCRCRPTTTSASSRCFRINSAPVARALLALVGNPRRAAFWCGDPVKDPDAGTLVPIITRQNLLS